MGRGGLPVAPREVFERMYVSPMRIFPECRRGRLGAAMPSLLVLGAALPFFGGCAGSSEVSSVTTTQNITSKTNLLTYHHRADIPWGSVPVVPPESTPVCAQGILQAGGFAMSEVSEGNPSTWSPSTIQGTGEFAWTVGWMRGGLGGRIGATSSGWMSAGLIERGEGGTHVFGDAAVGFNVARSTVDYRTDRTIVEAGRTTRDTLFNHQRVRRWNGFTRFSVGLVPDHAGPWATVQVIPSWTLTRWSRGGTEKVTITTTTYDDSSSTTDVKREPSEKEYTLENAMLLSVGLGWMQRFGSQSLTVGARYSVKELRQLEMILQISSEL